MAGTLGIDHPLVLVRDIEAAAARYRTLGFNTAPTGRHPWGTSTSLVMFDRSALELMGVYDETLLDSHAVGDFRFGRHMADALREREGVSLVALHSEDAAGDRARVAIRGLAAQGRVDFRRKVKVPGRDWDEAVVTLEILLDPALPRASNFLCQQHRPELVWVPEWLEHPNGALGFAGITYATRDPLPLLTRLRRLFGDGAVRETALGHEALTGRARSASSRPAPGRGNWASPGNPASGRMQRPASASTSASQTAPSWSRCFGTAQSRSPRRRAASPCPPSRISATSSSASWVSRPAPAPSCPCRPSGPPGRHGCRRRGRDVGQDAEARHPGAHPRRVLGA